MNEKLNKNGTILFLLIFLIFRFLFQIFFPAAASHFFFYLFQTGSFPPEQVKNNKEQFGGERERLAAPVLLFVFQMSNVDKKRRALPQDLSTKRGPWKEAPERIKSELLLV